MYRAQILLERWQYEALKALSERRGSSVSELVRELLAERLGPSRHGKKSGLASIRGIGSNASAKGRDHDRWLYGGKKPRP